MATGKLVGDIPDLLAAVGRQRTTRIIMLALLGFSMAQQVQVHVVSSVGQRVAPLSFSGS